ncbi:Nucleotide-binding oligomerization domain-containing protein 2 [Holothuria leucospilota]|uniref:Nucleotide-binding oligomerization domain-containing protein 2 n=1 Tax=Holothuria leucospilota TaxID=206669 RepID=A0A9Q1H7P7_HOLLE|nr:Nucleotide-binding oligomerization domain-containing protein 2 [Holothuria leucospilota]
MDVVFGIILLVSIGAVYTNADLKREWTGCYSPQYVEIGETGYIHCQFPKEFNAIYWYDNAMDKSAVPILSYSNSHKTGSKYENGEYDILSNGSLVINDVSAYHEGTFKVVCIDSGELSRSFIVSVQTTVTPKASQPRIKGCKPGETRCLLTRKDFEIVTCTHGGSRPPVRLQWFERLSSHDRNIEPSTRFIEDGEHTFTTVSNVTLSFADDRFVVVLVCKLLNIPLGFTREREVLVDMTESSDLLSLQWQVIPFPIDSRATFQCSYRDKTGNYVWKTIHSTLSDIVAFSIMGQGYSVMDGFTITEFGDLIIESVNMHHERNYTCFYDMGERKSKKGITLFVAVPPTYPYITIDECRQKDTCTIDATSQGLLTCSVTGIRPAVSLLWSKAGDEERIRLTEGKESVVTELDLSTVSRTVFYVIPEKVPCHERITLHCNAEGMGARFLASPTTEVTLVKGNMCQEDSPGSVSSVIIPIIVIIIILVVGVTIFLFYYRKRQRNLRIQRKRHRGDEDEGLPLQDNTAHQNNPRSNFISHLRKLYSLQIYSTNVYVVSTFSQMDPSKISSDDKRFMPLSSYKQLFEEDLVSKGRIVIEGEAGCGKSAFAIEMAKEWSRQDEGSLLNNFPIFILLSLTELDKQTTIYKAIRDQLLPEDFIGGTIDLVESILQKESKYILFLDGFDEFSERNDSNLLESSLFKVLNFNLMANAVVYLLTRSVSYLRVFGDNAYPIVRLEPFTSVQIDRYLDAKFSNNKEICDDVKRKLRGNDYLESLCHIPLFLNMMTEQNIMTALGRFPFGKMTTFIQELLHFRYDNYKRKASNHQALCNYQPSKEMAKFAFDALKTKKNVYNVNSLHDLCSTGEVTAMIGMNIFTEKRKELSQRQPGVVKFTHNVYHYYYAAQFVASIEEDGNVTTALGKIDALTSEYVFIFACGINSKVVRAVVSYLLKLDDIYPYPISDCICNCLAEISSEQLDAFSDLLAVLCKKEHGMELRFTDRRYLTSAKVSLLQACEKLKIPVNILRLTNAVTQIDGGYLHFGSEFKVRVPKLRTCLITDFEQELNENQVLSLLTAAPELEELTIFSYSKPRRIKNEIIHCLKERKERSKDTLVAWITYDSLGKDGRVFFSYPSTTFGCWMNDIETAVVIMIDKPEDAVRMIENNKLKAFANKTLLKHKGIGKINAKDAVRIMKNEGLSEYFHQIGFSKKLEKLFLSELEQVDDFLKDILRLWQKVDDSSRTRDVQWYSDLLKEKMEKDIPSSFRNALEAANKSSRQPKHNAGNVDGAWPKEKQNIVTFLKPVYFHLQI